MEIFFSKFRYKFLAQGIRNLCCCIDRLVYLSVFYLYIIGFYFCWNVFIFQKGGGWNSFSRKDILYFIKPFEKFFSLVLDRAQFLRCKLSQFIYWLFIYWELFFPLDFSFFFFFRRKYCGYYYIKYMLHYEIDFVRRLIIFR